MNSCARCRGGLIEPVKIDAQCMANFLQRGTLIIGPFALSLVVPTTDAEHGEPPCVFGIKIEHDTILHARRHLRKRYRGEVGATGAHRPPIYLHPESTGTALPSHSQIKARKIHAPS